MSDHLLSLTHSQWEVMRHHVATQAPLEACGLLAGSQGTVDAVLLVKNAAASEVRFRMDPKEQLTAFAQIEAAGQEILAIFHSHPNGSPFPSATDIREAAYPVVHIIWAPMDQGWQARGFWIEAGDVVEISLNVKGV